MTRVQGRQTSTHTAHRIINIHIDGSLLTLKMLQHNYSKKWMSHLKYSQGFLIKPILVICSHSFYYPNLWSNLENLQHMHGVFSCYQQSPKDKLSGCSMKKFVSVIDWQVLYANIQNALWFKVQLAKESDIFRFSSFKLKIWLDPLHKCYSYCDVFNN